MSYYLISKKAQLVIDLGKMARMDENDNETPWHFTGWLDDDTGARVSGELLNKLIAHVCAHIIYTRKDNPMIISEEVLDTLIGDDPFEQWNFISSSKEIERLPVEV
ncbi:hypothetical protein [Deinococcus sp. UR1]|uniref:hypothetical protein n=1 Tax=Deinococcus sp. UR1 TaxID=1704277 RepID=UPI000A6834D1|nr:hypothetical protein [Deinococcus sp. UR1]